MADSAPAPVQKAKKVSKPKKPSDHPKYSEMVKAAVAALKERGGSSRQKILKYILANYKVGEEKSVNTHLKVAKVSLALGEQGLKGKPILACAGDSQTNPQIIREQFWAKDTLANLKVALRSGVKSGLLNQSKGTGASESFRLSDSAKKAPDKPKKSAAKKPAAKKPAAKKATKVKKPKSPAKKAAKKPAAKKSAAKKSTPKKPKVAKKPAAKKPVKKTPKKAAKKPAKK